MEFQITQSNTAAVGWLIIRRPTRSVTVLWVLINPFALLLAYREYYRTCTVSYVPWELIRSCVWTCVAHWDSDKVTVADEDNSLTQLRVGGCDIGSNFCAPKQIIALLQDYGKSKLCPNRNMVRDRLPDLVRVSVRKDSERLRRRRL